MTARLLIVEDERAIRLALSGLLRREGYEVDAVSDGREAVKRVRSGRRYRLAVLDLTMRDVGGAEALAAIRPVVPELPVILISGFTADEVEERGVVAGGGVTVLQKPFRLFELTDAVSAVAR